MKAHLSALRLLAGLSGLVLGYFAGERSARAEENESREAVQPSFDPGNVTLPVEYASSAAWLRGTDSPPAYRVSATVLPGYMFWGRLTVHALGQYAYRSPGWEFAAGARASVVVWTPLGGLVPVKLSGDAACFIGGGGCFSSGGPAFGLGTLLYLMPNIGYDGARNVLFAGVRFGLDVLALGDPVGAITRFAPARVETQ
jgi:hypothetical protein